MAESESGWAALEDARGTASAGGPDDDDLARAFAACLRGSDGERVLAFLRASTIERALGPDASEAQLRHLEGQRQLVALIVAMVRRGRG